MKSGKIHVAFDGWRARNRKSLYGIVIFWADENTRLRKLLLDMPEVSEKSSGVNIGTHIVAILTAFRTQSKIGYFTLDNAGKSLIFSIELPIFLFLI